MSRFGTAAPTIAEMMAPRDNNLTALRLLAAICVVISHCALLKIGVQDAEPLADVMFYSLGEHALHAFFFISGLTIAASLVRADSILEFTVARILRIWPALVTVTIVLALVAAPLLSRLPAEDYFADPSWKRFVMNGFFLSASGLSLPGLFVDNPHLPVVDGSPWTLKYEVICYLVLGLGSICISGRKELSRSTWVMASTLVAAMVMVILPPHEPASHFDHIARLWFAFSLGVLTWQFADRLRPSLLIVAGIGIDLYLSLGTTLERPLSILFVAALILWLAAIPTGAVRRFTNRTDLSYGVYITAWPVTQTLVEKFPDLPLWAVTILTLLLATALAFASWTLIEKPAMKLRPIGVLILQGCGCVFRRTSKRTKDSGPVHPDLALGH